LENNSRGVEEEKLLGYSLSLGGSKEFHGENRLICISFNVKQEQVMQ